MISALTPWCIRKHLYLMKNGRHKAPSDFPRAAKCRPGSRGDGHAARQGAAGLLATAATDGPGKAVRFISPISPRPWPGEPRAVGSFQGSQLRVLSPRVRPVGPSQTPASPTQDQPCLGFTVGRASRTLGARLVQTRPRQRLSEAGPRSVRLPGRPPLPRASRGTRCQTRNEDARPRD